MSKETPLYSCHLKHNAKMVDFVGWKLPVEYEGLVKEHLAVRESVGIFDVSHMGEIDIKGSKALEFVQKITTNNVAALKNGQVQYSLMCYETGGIVDDVLVHRFNENHFFLCSFFIEKKLPCNSVSNVNKFAVAHFFFFLNVLLVTIVEMNLHFGFFGWLI